MYVVGTAGHVDHGKSTLVEALTGIDPDRLAEEKERGLTIDLGFAWLRLPGGNEVSIVDVPGHERFVNNMLAGVGGIDLALLVIAADESVMPQTREHLAILDLLQVKAGLVAITKIDQVGPDWLDLVVVDVEDVLQGTLLEGAPILPVSGLTGEGLVRLVTALEDLLRRTPPKKDLARPRLPIDRAFTIAGFGTVVTGTLVDGGLDVGQEIELAISGRRGRVRGLQTHRRKLSSAEPGNRVAVNLAGLSHEEIDRGEVLTTPGWLRPSEAVDVRLKVLPDAPHPIRHNMFVTVHTGSSEVIGRIRLLEQQTADPGDATWAQIKLESPLAVVKGDYYVIRSNRTTLGGGSIVDPQGRRHRRMHRAVLDRLDALEQGSEVDLLLRAIEVSEPAEFQDMVNRANLRPEDARDRLTQMTEEGLVVPLGDRPIGPGVLIHTAPGWASLCERAGSALEAYHALFPLRKGAPKEELRSRLGLRSQVFNQVLTKLRQSGVIVEEGATVRLPRFHPKLSDRQEGTAQAFLAMLEAQPYSPPTDSSIDAEVVNLLADEGRLVRVSETVAFSSAAYREMVDRISEFISERGEISVADVRDMFKTSRKYALALMDHMDHERITRRVGDVRVLR